MHTSCIRMRSHMECHTLDVSRTYSRITETAADVADQRNSHSHSHSMLQQQQEKQLSTDAMSMATSTEATATVTAI